MHPLSNPARGHRLCALAACGLLALSGMTVTQAQTTPPSIDASGDYRQEMQACMQGRTAQDRATCMREARNARVAKQRGALETPAESLGPNAMARCEGMAAADRVACRARVMGYGRTSGSVSGGGILRELEVVQMEPGQTTVNVAPQNDAPVLVIPAERR